MSIIISLIVGVLIGWVVSVLKRPAGREDLIRNIAAGVAGAYLGGWLLGRMLDTGQQASSFGAIIASLLGAAALLFIVARFNRA